MLHVYFGDGKGKTTAAFGLALRMAGAGRPVRVVQFLKDGSSHEVAALAGLAGVSVSNDGALAKFTFLMTPAERAASRALHDRRLQELLEGRMDGLTVVDEALGSLGEGLVDEGLLRRLCDRAAGSGDVELVLTGRESPAWLLGQADYATRMALVAHPFARGVDARLGVEY